MPAIAYVVLVISPFLAIASLIRISLHGDRSKGKMISILLLIFSCIFIYFVNYHLVPRAQQGMGGRLMCGTNLAGLGKALMVYANDNDDMLPDANQWCDLLVIHADVNPQQFVCRHSGAKYGESSYVLNKEVVGMKITEIPPDMVLVFETNQGKTESGRDAIVGDRLFSNQGIVESKLNDKVYKDRWNQVGGPELLSVESHVEGCNILYADSHVRFERAIGLAELRWKLEGKAEFALPSPSKSGNWFLQNISETATMSVLALVCVTFTIYILIKYDFAQYWIFILLLTLLSAGAGILLGDYSEEAYSARHSDAGWISGGFFGLLAGICFAILFANCSEKIKKLNAFAGFASYVGMVTGIICSSLVHIALMIVYGEINPFGIVIGLPYGIAAGAVLGYISGRILRRFYSISDEIKG